MFKTNASYDFKMWDVMQFMMNIEAYKNFVHLLSTIVGYLEFTGLYSVLLPRACYVQE